MSPSKHPVDQLLDVRDKLEVVFAALEGPDAIQGSLLHGIESIITESAVVLTAVVDNMQKPEAAS